MQFINTKEIPHDPVLWDDSFSKEELRKTLSQIIDHEMGKTDIEMDAGLIGYCERLLWALHEEKTRVIPSHREENRLALQIKIRHLRRAKQV